MNKFLDTISRSVLGIIGFLIGTLVLYALGIAFGIVATVLIPIGVAGRMFEVFYNKGD